MIDNWADVQDIAERMEELRKGGKVVEAGWAGLEMVLFSAGEEPNLPDDPHIFARNTFYAGAAYIFSQLLLADQMSSSDYQQMLTRISDEIKAWEAEVDLRAMEPAGEA